MYSLLVIILKLFECIEQLQTSKRSILNVCTHITCGWKQFDIFELELEVHTFNIVFIRVRSFSTYSNNFEIITSNEYIHLIVIIIV